jgi:integrase
MPKLSRLPSYRLHKASGQAVVTLSGADHYLGIYGTKESQQAYKRRLSEWLAGGKISSPSKQPASDLTIDEVFVRYWSFVTTYYVKDGKPTGEQHALKSALTPLVELYGPTTAMDFGPLELKAVRETMINKNLSRRLINVRVHRIRRMFKWAVENGMLPPHILHGLQAVSPLRRGRCPSPDPEPVRPLSEELFQATLPHLSPEIKAMVELQWHTGMRPGEVVIMRRMDIDRSSQVWEYRPASHKTQHHGIERVIPLGPKAQAVLTPFLSLNPEEFCFSPRRKMRAWNEKRRKNRATPMTPSQAARRPKRNRAKPPGEHYTTASYGRAIADACKKASLDVWGPNRLRHTAATRLRKLYGLDAARVVLGHRSAAITEVYAEIDRNKAIEVMSHVG